MSPAVDLERMTVMGARGIVRPTRAEWLIVVALARRPGVVFSIPQLMDAAELEPGRTWGALRTHIRRLRARGVTQIETRYDLGYAWRDA